MKRKLVTALFALTLLSAAAPANATEDAKGGSTLALPWRRVSLTLDAAPLVTGLGVLRGEAHVARVRLFHPRGTDVSLGGFVGFGRTRFADGSIGASSRPAWLGCSESAYCDEMTTIWAQVQALAYPIGGFDEGLQVGLEAGVLGGWGTRWPAWVFTPAGALPRNGRSVSDTALRAGIVVGYKLVGPSGITVNPQLAADLVASSERGTGISPRITLDTGWSW